MASSTESTDELASMDANEVIDLVEALEARIVELEAELASSTEAESLSDEELAGYEAALVPPRLIAAYRAARDELQAKSWATQEFDEETGYCLCGCCRHGV